MSDKINPLTGEVVSQNINPLTGLPVTTKTPSYNAFTGTVVGAGDYSGYAKYGVQFDPWSDMDELRAQRQTELEKWKNGLTKAGVTFAGAVAENTIGTVLGLGDYVLSGFDDFDKSMSENPIGVMFDDINQYMQKELPNYYTKEEMSKQGTLASLGTANFWADKFANGAAYSLGSMASMFITGGYGAIGGGLKLAGATGKMSSSLAAYKTAKAIKAGATLKEALGTARSAKAYGMRLGKAAQMAEAGMMMSMAESAVEARETKKKVREQLIEEAKKRKMRTSVVDLDAETQVDSWENVELTAQELQQIDLQAQQAEGAAFYGNMAVLAPTNLIMFGKGITPFSSATRSTNKIVRTTAEGGKKAFVDVVETLPKYLKSPAKIGRAAKPYVEGAITEGFQEGAQYAISEGIAEYEAEKFNDAGSGELVESLLNAGLLADTRELIKASPEIGKQAVKSFSEAEGREQMLIGAMVGLLSKGRAGFREYTTKKENTKKITGLLNNENFYNLATRAEDLNRAVAISNSMNAALEAGDKTAYELRQGDLIANEILTHINHGSLDMFIERMEDAKQLEDAEFKDLFGIDENTEINKEEIVDGVLNQIDVVKNGKEIIDTLFPTTETYGLPKMLMGKKRRQQEEEANRDQEIYKNTLLRTYSRLSHIDNLINDSLKNLGVPIPSKLKNRLQKYKRTKFGEVLIDLQGQETVKLTEGQNLPKTIEELKSKLESQDLSPLEREIVNQKLDQLSTLIQYRNTATLAFDNLIKDPKQRDLHISREKARARNAELQSIYDNLINNTSSSKDLKTKFELEEDSIPDELKNDIEKEILEREAAELEFKRSLDELSLDEVKAKKTEDLTSVQRAMLDEYISTREEKGQVDPIVKKPTNNDRKKASENADKKSKKRSERKPRATPKDDEDDDGPSDAGAGTTPTTTSPTQPSNKGTGSETVTRTTTDGVTRGEFVLDSEGRIIVSDNGEPLDSEAFDTYPNGEPVITNEGKELLRDPNLVAGAEVELRVVETGWWEQNKNNIDIQLNSIENTPVFVFYKGVPIGKLTSGNTKMREAAVKAYQDGKGVVTTQIKARRTNNDIYLRTEDGRPFYSNPIDVFGKNVPIAAVRFDPEKKIKYLDVGNVEESQVDAILSGINSMYPNFIESAPLGQIMFVYTDPNGRYRLHRAHTAVLSAEEVETAFQYMMDGKADELADLVGTNGVPLEVQFAPSGTYFRINPNPIFERRVYELNLVGLLSQFEKAGADKINIVAVSDELLRRLNSEESIEDIIKELLGNSDKGQKWYGTINNLIRQKNVVEGRTDYIGVGTRVLSKTDDLEAFLKQLTPAIKTALAQKRRQVDLLQLQNDPTYFERLANTDHVKTGEFEGRAGVIATDSAKIHGNHVMDIGLDLSDSKVAVDGKAVEEVGSAPKPPKKPKPQTTTEVTVSEPEEDEYYPDEDGDEVVLGKKDLTGVNLGELLERRRREKEAEEKAKKTNSENSVTDSEDDAPFRLAGADKVIYKKLNKSQATSWLKERGIPIEFYDVAKNVGGRIAHGYMQNATVYLWNNAEVGTEYHEAFHYVFRTLLNDKQREGLYKEAREKFGLQKASELELEEAMAEDFRDYVFTAQETAKTLPQKIRKFFKDLLNFIKAVVRNPVEIDQIYSLIESNKFPRKYERNTEKFEPTAKAYRYVDDFAGEQVNKDTILTVIGHFQKELKDYEDSLRDKDGIPNKDIKSLRLQRINDLLGVPGQSKGLLAEYYLRRSLSIDGKAIPNTPVAYNGVTQSLFQHMADAIDTKNTAAMTELAKTYGIKNLPPQDLDIPSDVFRSPQQAKQTATMFWRLYTNWNDVIEPETENITKYGWREAVVQEMKRFGYDIKSRLIKSNDLDGREEELEENKVTYDKIYNISNFEISPTTKFSEDVKQFFGKMVGQTPNTLGYYSPIDIQQTIRYTLMAAYGKSSLEEMIKSIENSAEHLDILKPVALYLRNEMTGKEAAAFKAYLNLDYTDHRLFEIETRASGNKTARIFKLIKADTKSAAKQFLFQWKREGRSERFDRDNSLYNAQIDKNENTVLTLNNNVIDGKSRAQRIAEGFKKFNSASTPQAKVAAAAEVFWEMSIQFGDSKEQSITRLISHINDFETDEERLAEANDLGLRAKALAQDVFDVEVSGREVRGIKLKDNPLDIFSNKDTALTHLAEIAAKFSLPISSSFINSKGKAIYPYNLPTPFTDYMKEFTADEQGSWYEALSNSDFITAYGEVDYSSLLYRLLGKKKTITSEFEVKSFSMSAFKDSEDEYDALEYKQLTPRDSLIVRLNAYSNEGNNNFANYAMSIKETRTRLDFMSLPKFTNNTSMGKSKLGRMSKQQIIEGIIVRDLIKLSKGETNESKDTPVFHLSGIEDRRVGGVRLSSGIKFAIENPESDTGKAVRAEVSKMAQEYLENTFQKNVNSLGERLVSYGLAKRTKNKDGTTSVRWSEKTKLSDSITTRGVVEFAEEYAFNDMVARIEMGSVFRNGINQYKDLTEFFKREGLLDTPGNKMLLAGEFEGDLDYGMLEEFTEATTQDYKLTDPEHDKIAERIEKSVKESLIRRGYEEKAAAEEAKEIAKQYKRSFGADISDAQAYISPEMFRRIQMGFGAWTSEDDVWYNEYLKGGEWKAKYSSPFKFYYENIKSDPETGKMTIEMDKNSYHLLTRDMVEGSDLLKDMYQRMMGEGKYSGMAPIHVMNVVSAKKGYTKQDKKNAFEVDQNAEVRFAGIETNTQRGDRLYRPQAINYSERQLAAINRQIRTNMIGLVEDNYKYTVNGKTVNGKQLKARYYKAIDDLLEFNEAKLKKELGYDKLEKDFLDREARLNFLKNVRRVFLDSALKNDALDDNTEKQLQLIEDAEGDIDFTLPVQFTPYQRKYQNLFFSLYKNNVFRMELPGKDLVQVSSPGKFEVNNELRELRHIDVSKDGKSLKHAEVMLSQDMLDKLGLKVGDTGIAYRIPHQGYSSTVPIKIVGVLPKSYSKSIMVPGNIVIQTGSDFDIDKLFTLFRDNVDTDGAAKYRNEIIDILESISLSTNHVAETLRPLDQEELNELADEYGGVTKLNFDSPLTEIAIQSNFQSAAALVGAYANGLAGISVAVHGRSADERGGVRVHPNRHFKIVKDGEVTTLDSISKFSKLTGKPSFAGMIKRLSAALDAGKKLIHSALNDNSYTVNTIIFLESIGLDEATITAMMNMPLVREFVTKMRSDARNTANDQLKKMSRKLGILDFKRIKDNFEGLAPAEPMSIEEMKQVIESKDMESPLAKKLFRNFMIAYYAGEDLRNDYTSITPDKVDGMGDLAEIEAYLGSIDGYRRSGSTSTISPSDIQDFLIGDAYPPSRSFYTRVFNAMTVSNELFLGGTDAVRSFKSAFQDLTGKKFLTAKAHRTLDRALLYYMFTKEGSPIGDLLTQSNVKKNFLNRNNNLYTRIKKLRKAIPAINTNTFISKVTEGNGFSDPNTDIFTILVDNVEKLSPLERERQKKDLLNLVRNPELYTEDAKEQASIKDIGEAIILNAIVSNGLSPTFGSYFQAIPIEYFLEVEKDGVTLGEFFREQVYLAKNDSTYFEEAMVPIIRNYGTRRVDNDTLVPTVFSIPQSEQDIDDGPQFLVKRDSTLDRDKHQLWVKRNGEYKLLQHMSIGGKLIEMNLRDSQGNIANETMFTKFKTGKDRRPLTTSVDNRTLKDINVTLNVAVQKLNAEREQLRKCEI